MSTMFIECEPAGPLAGADCAGARQVGRAWWRQFSRRILHEGHSGYAMVIIAYFVEDVSDDGEQARLVLKCRTRYLVYSDPTDPTGTSTYDRAVTEEQRTSRAAGPTEADAEAACARFKPDTIDWDGWPGSEKLCEPATHIFADGNIAAYCATHGTPLHDNAEPSASAALRELTCDRGRGWWFLVDTSTPGHPAPPRLADLTGAHQVVVTTIEDNFYGTGDTPAQFWRYRSSGQLCRLTLSRVPGDASQRDFADGDDRTPLIITQQWQLTDPETGDVYLQTSIALNGDA